MRTLTSWKEVNSTHLRFITNKIQNDLGTRDQQLLNNIYQCNYFVVYGKAGITEKMKMKAS